MSPLKSCGRSRLLWSGLQITSLVTMLCLGYIVLGLAFASKTIQNIAPSRLKLSTLLYMYREKLVCNRKNLFPN